MSSEIGSATFGLVVGLGRFKAGLAEGKQDAAEAGKKTGDAFVDETSESIEKGSGKLKAAMAVVAASAGAVFAVGFSDALDAEASNDQLAAQLGLSPEQAASFGRAAGELYADAYGDSLEQVNEALGAVQSSLGDALGPADDALKTTTAKVLDMAAAFGVDVPEAAQLAAVAVRHGLAKDADHALDLITVAWQRMPAAMRSELIPAIDEYGDELANMGFTGEEAFGLLAEASKDGLYGIDKTGDAIKELGIRATDMSSTSVDAYKLAGLGAEDMSAKFLAGGSTARGALNELIDGLLSIEDPTKRANAAIGLFGTPIEDLGVTEIPKFLESLKGMESSLGDVSGATSRMGGVLADNAKTELTAYGRSMRQNVSDFITGTVLPAIDSLPGPLRTAAVGFGVVGGAAGAMLGDIGPSVLALKGLGPHAISAGKGLMSIGGSAISAASSVVGAMGSITISGVKAAGSMALSAASTVASWVTMGISAMAGAAQMALAWLIAMGPAIAVGAAIAGIVALVVLNWDTIKRATGAAWDWVSDKIGAVVDFVKMLFMNFTGPGLLMKHWDSIKAGVLAVTSFLREKWDGFISFFTGIPGKISAIASGMWDGIKSAFKSAINGIIRGWNAIEFKIPGFDPPGPGPKFGGFTLGLPNIPLIAHTGGIIPGRLGSEIPTLLQSREGVFTTEQMAALAPIDRMADIAGPIGGDGADIIQLYLDGKLVWETVRDRQSDYDRRKHGRTRKVA